MKTRSELLKYLKTILGDVDSAVEIGVWRASFSEEIINILQPNNFYGVDPYAIFEGMVSAPGAEYNSQKSLDALYEKINQRISAKGHSVIRELSLDAASKFQENSLDYVYIDGDHTYNACKADIHAWWPKIRSGGILAGDDYDVAKTGKGYDFGVIEAVSEFSESVKLQHHVHKMRTTQWYIIKP